MKTSKDGNIANGEKRRSGAFWGIIIALAISIGALIYATTVVRDVLIGQEQTWLANNLLRLIGIGATSGILLVFFGGRYIDRLDRFVKKYYWIGFVVLGISFAIGYFS